MYIMPLSASQKVGVVFCGLAVGICAAIATTVAGVMLAFLLAALLTVAHFAGNDGGAAFLVLASSLLQLLCGNCRR